ncbi:RnfABCDGE type electron transport complex subunit B [Vibrio mangrovi]|uniref:Electron transport complex protein rnfB n=1 Tax=Vibrio mangrovi TaxID=474394 RepID=A0A1Y6INK5_9VIBR|nr:RnfABCDGE type electron transport complex subunit B [Vibrio mangrovi]MDW6003957.1 RnfABCDGE type electron transport complex subunit B [Vibrio mangrovi]SMR99249.1 Electron transport complex protein rnfB [Vibrio mangrovi]
MWVVGILFFILLGAILGIVLGYAAILFRVESHPLVDRIESMLPGGQCGQCGEAGCRQAAEKMVSGSLRPDTCPPGGAALAVSIAEILGESIDMTSEETHWIAQIEESLCTGCNRCYKACPFDAIVGAPKQLHTVIQDVCTGCQLCEKACTQHCLTMVESSPDVAGWYWPKPTIPVAV